MLDFLSRVIAYWASLPGTHLLVFTLVIWAAFSLVLLADARNHLNQWCFTGGMMFSVGALKEYLYYGLAPSLIASGIWTQAGASLMYSILSAVFYLLAIPCVMMFAFYFAQLNQTRFFPLLRVVVWLPAVCLSVRFPPDRVASLQRDPVFCLSIAGYNVLFGLIATLILLRALWVERHGRHNRQRRLVAVSVLLPLWVWLVAAFPYHALGIPHLDKIWQIELPVVLFTLCFLLYHAFREGIWGMRLRRETYDWSGSDEVLQRNTQYVAHALKNDLNKIDWCAALLDERRDRLTGSIRAALQRRAVDAESLPAGGLGISCRVNGELRQHSNTSVLIFSPEELVRYLMPRIPLKAGDVIFTGTPSGVMLGYPADQKRWLRAGDTVEVTIEGIGTLKNFFQ